MDIRITYCGIWNYLPKAQVVASEIRENYSNINIELVKGSGGVFDIQLNEQIIYSKTITKRFPYGNEINEKIKEVINGNDSKGW